MTLTSEQFDEAMTALDKLTQYKPSPVRVILNSEYEILRNQRVVEQLKQLMKKKKVQIVQGQELYPLIDIRDLLDILPDKI